MRPMHTNKPFPSSSFWFSSPILVLYLVFPLAALLLLVSVSGPEATALSPLSSPWRWRWRLGVLDSHSFAPSSSLAAPEENSRNTSVFTEPLVLEAARNNNSISRESLSSSNASNTGEIVEIKDISKNNESVKRYSKLERLEARLARARFAIKEAALVRNLTSTHQDPDYVPGGPIYRNPNAFHRSYLEMEKLFKIYVYNEGEPPIFHNGPCRSIYSAEGRFIHEMEKGRTTYRTKNPEEASVYFLPFSVVMMVQYLYEPNTFKTDAIGRAVVDYIQVIANKYPYWNRSLGADHVMLSCHDWGPRASFYVPHLFHKSIRVLCNANTSEGFNPTKDASFPEINLLTGEVDGLIGGPSPSRRSVLAFFSGRLHGHIRYLLLNEWKNKDDDIQVYDQLPNGVSYTSKLKNSKFCLCPSGYEVASPRVVEAIYAECVPVLISDSYVPPFSDVLNWKSFSVEVAVKDIPNIKKILMSIPQRQYLRMQRRVKQVQRHFVVNGIPKRFDVFHMTLHSIWLRRLNVRIQDFDPSLP